MSKTARMVMKDIALTMQKHKPTIFIGLGIGCMAAGTAFAIKMTPAAVACIEEEKERQRADKLKPWDVLRATWKCYIPTAVSSGVGIGLIIGGNSENVRRNAALVTAYTMTESALREYQDKVVDTIGEKKELLVRDAISKEEVEKNPVTKNEVFFTGKGTCTFLDLHSKRYFEFDVENLRTVQNNLNEKLLDEMFVSLNDFYSEVGLESTELGDQFGWDVNKTRKIEIYTSAQKAPDGRPILVVNYMTPPQYDYRRY